ILHGGPQDNVFQPNVLKSNAALHTQIISSSKLVPGRHVVSEVEGIVALNSATYKAMGKVKFVVLDDMVLVGKKYSSKTSAATPSSERI
ncbi:exocyst complex component exo84, partial [Marasmius tenuissimus]